MVLPVYNERGHLKEEIDRIREALAASGLTYEIIVVDDGSDDGSEVDLPSIEGIRLIRHGTNRGSGSARRTGTTAARGRDVAMQYVHQLPSGFSCVTTLTMSFLSNGYQVKYVPIEYFPRAGTSKFHWWRDTKRYLMQVVRMSLSYNPLKVFMPIGLTTLAVGIVKLAYDWIDRDFRLAANTLLILLASLQAIAVGLLADLVVRVTKPADQVAPA